MITGLDKFQEYFNEYTDSYIIIGGTACDIIIEGAGLKPRATKDIDIILIVEALDDDFVKRFWEFIKNGGYKDREKNEQKRNCYRFKNPINEGFPFQIELLARKPDSLDHNGEYHLTPIPVGEDLSSLSAILMDQNYYDFTLKYSTKEKQLNRANTEALICLKAKAYLNLLEEKAKEKPVKGDDIKKHKHDVFRMTMMLTPDQRFEIPETLKRDLQEFVEKVKVQLPDKAIFEEMGLGDLDPKEVLTRLIANFNLE